jgi:hypothetical protein
MGLIAHQDQTPFEAFAAQGVDRLGARLAATNDYDTRIHALPTIPSSLR